MELNRDTEMKRGDTAPNLTITCLDRPTPQDDWVPVDLSSGVTTIYINGAHEDGTLLIHRAVTGTAGGDVVLAWANGDTDTVGILNVEVEVTYASGKKRTFPVNGYIRVRIKQDLG